VQIYLLEMSINMALDVTKLFPMHLHLKPQQGKLHLESNPSVVWGLIPVTAFCGRNIEE